MKPFIPVRAVGTYKFEDSHIFCDWITVSQEYFDGVPLVNGGRKVLLNSDGSVEYDQALSKRVEGLHGSAVQIRSDGKLVSFSGNPARWNKVCNAYGVSFDDSMKIVNSIMVNNGLPPFSGGEYLRVSSGHVYTGARFSRIDMTAMVSLGEAYNRDRYLDFLQLQTHSTLKKKSIIGKSVYFGRDATGERSQSRIIRFYDKAEQLVECALRFADSFEREYLNRIIRHLEDNGVLRVEVEMKRFLRSQKARNFDDVNHRVLCDLFRSSVGDFMRETIEIDTLEDIPTFLLGTVAMYLQGIDVKKKLSKATYYRHKAELRKYGFDIGNRSKIETLRRNPIPIKLDFPSLPDGRHVEVV